MTLFYSVTASKPVKYQLHKSSNLFSHRNKILLMNRENQHGGKCFVIIDNALYGPLYTEIVSYFEYHNIELKLIKVEGLESSKIFESVLYVISELNDFGIQRRSEPVLVIGGGVVMDIGSLACSLFRRGIPHIRVPTTLMGYVDAGIGIKTGVDYQNCKNRLGTYEPPSAVILDKGFLETLPSRHIVNGMGEVIKIAVIKDGRLFEDLKSHGKAAVLNHFQELGDSILDASIHGLITELETNLWETELKRPSDFGHTFSPIIEMKLAGELLHGECVAIDIAISSVIARKRELISQGRLDDILNMLDIIGLPCYHFIMTIDLLMAGLEERTIHRNGHQNCPVPTEQFQCEFLQDVTPDELKHAILYLK
jgi:2-epi-5-epi-valiolone synthase